MYIANGAPKTGTRLLQKVLRGFDGVGPHQVGHYHKPYGEDLDNHIHIIRNPRNMMISWHRFTNQDSSIIDKMPGLIGRAQGFTGWLTDDKTMTVRFEELLTNPDVIKQIGERLDLVSPPDHFRDSYGGTITFTGKDGPNFSIWQSFQINGKLVWTDEVHEAWVSSGGLGLEEAWGYDVNKKYVRQVNG